jgi:hypothetical protein
MFIMDLEARIEFFLLGLCRHEVRIRLRSSWKVCDKGGKKVLMISLLDFLLEYSWKLSYWRIKYL